jgi:hypothetical protein
LALGWTGASFGWLFLDNLSLSGLHPQPAITGLIQLRKPQTFLEAMRAELSSGCHMECADSPDATRSVFGDPWTLTNFLGSLTAAFRQELQPGKGVATSSGQYSDALIQLLGKDDPSSPPFKSRSRRIWRIQATRWSIPEVGVLQNLGIE